jgi:hypothetical protein
LSQPALWNNLMLNDETEKKKKTQLNLVKLQTLQQWI